jgi:zinc transport system permease protein
MFEYGFMVRALWVGLMIAFIAPFLGQTLVLRRLSMISDAISHATLAGIAIGMLLGINPILSAIVTSIIGVSLVDILRKRLPDYAEVAIAILMAIGIGLAGTLSSFVADSANFSAFLFGSIVATTKTEVIWIGAVALVITLLYIVFYKEFFAITFDEEDAKYSGVNVKLINALFMLMLGITLSIAAKTVGSLILSSLLIMPVASSLQFAKSYKTTLLWSILFSLISMMGGLTLSFYFSLKPGGAVVLLSVVIYLVILPLKGRRNT